MIIKTGTGVRIVRDDYKRESLIFATKAILTAALTALIIAVLYAGFIIFD